MPRTTPKLVLSEIVFGIIEAAKPNTLSRPEIAVALGQKTKRVKTHLNAHEINKLNDLVKAERVEETSRVDSPTKTTKLYQVK